MEVIGISIDLSWEFTLKINSLSHPWSDFTTSITTDTAYSQLYSGIATHTQLMDFCQHLNICTCLFICINLSVTFNLSVGTCNTLVYFDWTLTVLLIIWLINTLEGSSI